MAFRECDSLAFIEIPDAVTYFGRLSFMCRNLTTMILYSAIPPELFSVSGSTSCFYYTPSSLTFYVPDSAVETYKTADKWSSMASRIKPMSEDTG